MADYLKIIGGQDRHLDLLAGMITDAWCIRVDSGIMKGRLNSGQFFVVAYDIASEQDKKYVDTQFKLSVEGFIPVGIIETIDLRTGGDYSRVPKSLGILAGNGYWRRPLENPDTLVLVDATVLATRRGSPIGENLVKSALEGAISNPDYSYLWTYTPDIESVRKWHEKFGAKRSDYKLVGARPNFSHPDVTLMDYSHLLKR